VERGETIAITGPNGSGKTSLLLLLLGLDYPGEGGAFVDGVPYEELDIVELRRHFGVILQHPMLSDGTIRDNITYGEPAATDEQVAQAASLSTADEFIRRLPDGYETRIGEGGVQLSGGEQQRLAIARALVRRPSFLLLDEPTNHLDPDAVSRLANNLKQLCDRPAVVLVTHDQRILNLAGRTYVLSSSKLKAA
jgi:ABC-type bacteriocin/lantibiotic exporter with double-glycine peptidase domain